MLCVALAGIIWRLADRGYFVEFMSIPKEVIGPNEVFVEYHDGGSEIWDNDQGQVKWRSALAASSP